MHVIESRGALWQPYAMPSKERLRKTLDALVRRMFAGKRPAEGRRPVAVVTVGVQGAGKSTAVGRNVPASYVVIDPDRVTDALVGRRPLPDDGPVFSLSNEWTHEIIRYALRNRFDFVYDTALPSRATLAAIRASAYTLRMLLVRTRRPVARAREVERDLRRGWGRPGVGIESHRSTRDAIARKGPELAARYADELTVCDNGGRVMRCAPCPVRKAELARLFRM